MSQNKRSAKGKNDPEISPRQIIEIGIILFGIYLVIRHTIGFNFIPQVTPNMGLGILFIVGAVTSLHCIAMCGGINLSQCVSYQPNGNESSQFSKFGPSLMYNAGRVISYTIIGGIVGAIGSVISISNTGKAVVSVIAGLFMIIMGLNMLHVFPWLKKLNPSMPKWFARKIYDKKQKTNVPFYVGLLNGLMPCGPLQAMQIYALGTGSFVMGALSMFMFSLGTVPLMFGFGAVSSMLSVRFNKRMMKVSALLVMVLGIVMANRGFGLAGVNVSAGTKTAVETGKATLTGEIQEITTNLQSRKYEPITVQAGIPAKWTIKAEQGSLNGCNYMMVVPEYGIEKALEVGDNVIEFTPAETGNFGYSCWMGMIRSNIKVVDELGSEAGAAPASLADEINYTNVSGGCCGR